MSWPTAEAAKAAAVVAVPQCAAVAGAVAQLCAAAGTDSGASKAVDAVGVTADAHFVKAVIAMVDGRFAAIAAAQTSIGARAAQARSSAIAMDRANMDIAAGRNTTIATSAGTVTGIFGVPVSRTGITTATTMATATGWSAGRWRPEARTGGIATSVASTGIDPGS